MTRVLAVSVLSAAAAAAVAALVVWREAGPAFPPGADAVASAPESIASGKLPFTPLEAPRALPEIGFVNGDGEAMALSGLHGRIVILNLWATWCVPCREEMPALDRLQAKMGGPDFAVIPLSIDRQGRDVVERFYRELGLKSLGIYLDPASKAAHAVNVVGVPTTLLIDREGRELGRKIGAAEWDGPDMTALIQRHLGQTTAAGSEK